MIRKFLLVLGVLTSTFAAAQNFEGVIEFKKKSLTDTVNYMYSVKGNMVRIDEINQRTHRIDGSFLLNLQEGSMIYLNHERKTWGRREKTGKPVVPTGLNVSSTKVTKTFFGYKCNQHIVKNTADNSSIHYYVSPGRFTFFVPMLELLNRREDFSTHYLSLPVKDGSFPFLAIKFDAAGKEVGRLEVTRIEKKTVSASVFEVPKDYKEFK
ncbi:MAG: DUF4412 domain-containing protein [Bacteroidia bacterium]|jgi:hypothetical protein|nr:DUF4412 domain-containing protein [Bacteroidia bacterium]